MNSPSVDSAVPAVDVPFELLEFFLTNEIYPAPEDLDFEESEIPY